MSVHAIVFSRDRAAQLDLLLTSLTTNAPDLADSLTVLWRATDELYRHAYDVCRGEHPQVEFVAESSFADDVRSLLAPAEQIVFFTDDSVLFRPLEGRERAPGEWLIHDPELLAFSLRLGRNCEDCYPHSRRQLQPEFSAHGDALSWSWSGADGDFGYPMSLDGHVMDAALPMQLLGARQPANPNELEAAMAQAVASVPLARRVASYRESHLVCIPANRVNETHPNRFDSASGADPHSLNVRYLSGERLDLGGIDFTAVDAAHAELRLAWRGAPRSGSRESVCLIAVVSGSSYEEYAERMFESARRMFHPADDVEFLTLPGAPGWPEATLYRHHVLAHHLPQLRHDYVFMVDADMLVESPIGPEILAPLVATRHPGFVTTARSELPYERRPESAAQVREDEGGVYYAGGFLGGERGRLLELSQRIAASVDRDESRGVLARWHDESHLNRSLIDTPPFLTLSPAYCYPDDDSRYRRIWRQRYRRALVALDKPNGERV
ncbi:MAG TPA: hypothetical protein VGG41_18670 [Solirubrobacteraceae bacterium]|jgi:hypothetical protein